MISLRPRPCAVRPAAVRGVDGIPRPRPAADDTAAAGVKRSVAIVGGFFFFFFWNERRRRRCSDYHQVCNGNFRTKNTRRILYETDIFILLPPIALTALYTRFSGNSWMARQKKNKKKLFWGDPAFEPFSSYVSVRSETVFRMVTENYNTVSES